jgi:tellurite resistance protein TerC
LFVFLVVFRFFAVPENQQHGVLFWGIIGAMILRGIFIFAGVGLIQHFHWVLYVFGALLMISGIKFARSDREAKPDRNPIVRALRRWIPVTDSYQGGKFFVRDWRGDARLYATPLLLVLLIIETSDVLFAVDSIPAVLSITLNAFIVYTSNVFAILGLRSMYFAVAELIKIFRYLHYGLAALLILVGLKMITADYYPISTAVTLGVVGGVLSVSVIASVLHPAKEV